MQATILISGPGQRNLGASTANAARLRLGGGDLSWLAPDEACEFLLEGPPAEDVRREVLSELQADGVDMAVLPAADRRKRILLADMDSTMILEESIDELAEFAGVGNEVKAITAAAMNGQLDFEDALRERVRLVAGLATSAITDVLETRITLAPGGPELVATMKANGAHAALVSGGFSDFSAVVADRLGFDEHRSNRLLRENGRLTGEAGDPILGRDAKVVMLRDLTRRLGLGHDDVIAVGDGANDLGMLGLAGTGVALHAKPVVARECDIVLNFADLTGLLYLQGYARSEFVTPRPGRWSHSAG